MDVEGPAQFQIGHEKPFPQEIKQLTWSNKMDLLAVVTQENILELHRISYKSQKVFHVEEINQIIGTCFSPDSYLLIYACDDGSMNVVRTENGKRLFSVDKVHKCSISSLDWVEMATGMLGNIGALNLLLKNSMLDNFILPMIPHETSDKKNVMKLNFLSDFASENDMRLLVTSDIASNLHVTFNGLFPIAKFNIQALLSDYQLFNPATLSTLFFDDLASFHVLLAANTADEKKYLTLACIDSNIIRYYQNDIANVAYLMSFLDNMISFLNNSFVSLNKQIFDVVRSYENKMYIMEDLIKNNHPSVSNSSQAGHGANEKMPTVSEEFLRFLISGEQSVSVESFLKKEVFDTNILEKMDSALNKKLQGIQELLTESMQSTVQRMMVVISQLESFAAQGHKYQLIGLDPLELRNLSLVVKQIFNLCDEVLIAATETKLNVRNLIVWLNRSVIKSFENENDQEIQNHKFPLKDLQVDVQRLQHFLSNEDRFRLKDLKIFTENKVDLPIKDEDDIKTGSLKNKQPPRNKQNNNNMFAAHNNIGTGSLPNTQTNFNRAISSVIGSQNLPLGKQASGNSQIVQQMPQNIQGGFQSGSGLLQNQILELVLSNIQSGQIQAPPPVLNGIVETREAQPKETSGLLQKIPKSNLIITTKNLEKQWTNIFLKIQNEISSFTKKPQEIIKLCPLPQGKTRFKQFHSFSEKDSSSYKLVIPGVILGSPTIQLFRIRKENTRCVIQVAFVKVPQDFIVRDMCFEASNKLLVLLSRQTTTESMNCQDAGESFVHLVDDDRLIATKEFPAGAFDNKISTSLVESIAPSEIFFNEMCILKTIRFATSNCDYLQSSLRGLNSIIQESNKIIIFD